MTLAPASGASSSRRWPARIAAPRSEPGGTRPRSSPTPSISTRSAPRSEVSGERTNGCCAKMIKPTRSPRIRSSSAPASRCARASRVGGTSSAIMLCDTSSTNTSIDAAIFDRGFARAELRARGRERRKRDGGDEERQRVRRCASPAGARTETAAGARPPTQPPGTGGREQRDEHKQPQVAQRAEAHASLRNSDARSAHSSASSAAAAARKYGAMSSNAVKPRSSNCDFSSWSMLA